MKLYYAVDIMTSHLDTLAAVVITFPSSGYNSTLMKFLLEFCRNDVRSNGSRKTSVHGPSNVAVISGVSGDHRPLRRGPVDTCTQIYTYI